MKKIFALTIAFIAGIALTANAGSIAPGQMTKCNDAKSITLSTKGPANDASGKGGFTVNDRGGANVVVWKSSNFTTIPISLGPSDTSGLVGNSSGNSKPTKVKCKDTTQCVPGAVDSSPSGVRPMWTKGRQSVTLTGQSNFSRGDSIGDISGEVRITNTGTVPGNVTCG